MDGHKYGRGQAKSKKMAKMEAGKYCNTDMETHITFDAALLKMTAPSMGMSDR